MILADYRNGNVSVKIFADGTKLREYNEIPTPIYPESIDLKITNYCDLHGFCLWCHEGSDKYGKHADLDWAYDKLKDLPAGIEIAIGGGNPLSHPHLENFLTKCKKIGLICNLTVNGLHLKKYKKQLIFFLKKQLIWGLGISYKGHNRNEIKELVSHSDNVVIHLIAGINHVRVLDELSDVCKKVLVLGYKQIRKGKRYYSEDVVLNIDKWYKYVGSYFKDMKISFDNLAIKQLNIRRFFTDNGWNEFYMGDDGIFTMYIDAVEQECAKSSVSLERIKLNNIKNNFYGIKTK